MGHEDVDVAEFLLELEVDRILQQAQVVGLPTDGDGAPVLHCQQVGFLPPHQVDEAHVVERLEAGSVVVLDGAAEDLVVANDADDWDLRQGSVSVLLLADEAVLVVLAVADGLLEVPVG